MVKVKVSIKYRFYFLTKHLFAGSLHRHLESSVLCSTTNIFSGNSATKEAKPEVFNPNSSWDKLYFVQRCTFSQKKKKHITDILKKIFKTVHIKIFQQNKHQIKQKKLYIHRCKKVKISKFAILDYRINTPLKIKESKY